MNDLRADFTGTSGEVTAQSAADMRSLGEDLGSVLEPGSVVVLTGPLGAGKTTFTQGIARGLGAAGKVRSPTFTVVREHRPGIRPDGSAGTGMLHMDAYRLLGDAVDTAVGPQGADLPRETVLDMLESLDIDDDLSDRVLVAEWGRGVVEALSSRVIDVEILRSDPEEGPGVGDLAEESPRILRWAWSS